jgi:hypothetical protein
MSLVAYQKQFVLGPSPVAIRPDWLIVRIGEGLILSHCPKLRLQPLLSKDSVSYWLLGLAVRADEPMSSISDGFRLKHSTEIENWTGYWAGRWLLITADRCIQDASGCFGICYRRLGDDFWISSSPALLGQHLPGASSAPRLPWRVTHEKGMDWIPLPFTTREDVYRLLPLRALEPKTGLATPVRFTTQAANIREDAQALAFALKNIVTNWTQTDFRKRLTALTAGLDTRTILASGTAAGVQLEAFTMSLPITPRRDLILPPRVASRAHVTHTFRRPKAVDTTEVDARMAAINEHMDGATFHPVAMHMARHNYEEMNARGQSVAHGNSFGIGRCLFSAKLTNLGREIAPTDPDHILASFTFRSSWRPEPLALWRGALQAWIESLSDSLPLVLDWRDRFYLEQRLAGWNSTTQALWELLDSTTFYPGNCLWISDLFLGFSSEQRKVGFPQREVIRILAPELLKIPVNPEPISKVLRKRFRTFLGPKLVYWLKSLSQSSDPQRAR